MKKEIIKVSGYHDSKIVFSGIFKFTETTGLPLTDVLESIKNHDVLIDWLDYYKMALNAGLKKKRIFSRISEALVDVHGVEYKNVVLIRLNYAIDNNYF